MNTTDTMRDYRTGGIYTYLSMRERDINLDGVPVVATLEATANFGGINYGSFRWSDGMVTIEALCDMLEAFRAFDSETHGRIVDSINL